MQDSNTANSTFDVQAVAVIGLGFIGLPLSMSYTKNGVKVVGIDVNERHIERLKTGVTDSIEAYEGRLLQDYLQEALQKDLFIPTTHYQEASQHVSVYIVTVGIPIINGIAMYEALDSATKELAAVIKPGDLILYRSTHIPGTVNERLVPILQSISPYRIGDEIHVAYAPERVAEGRALEEFQTVDVLIGGINQASIEHAKAVLRLINKATLHEATSIEMAETSKVIENVQRDVNIAMAQEIARFAQATGLRTSELIRLANTHPRVNLLIPGAGVGGYCIPNAYYYLQHKADDVDLSLPILATARQTNDYVPQAIIDRIDRKLGGLDFSATKIAVLGLAMKNFSNDDRISPSVTLVEMLIAKGAQVEAFDPLVDSAHHTYCASSLEACIAEANVIIVTIRQEAWDQIGLSALMERAPHCRLVFDACEAIVGQATEDTALLRI